jgi:hypothetical protein
LHFVLVSTRAESSRSFGADAHRRDQARRRVRVLSRLLDNAVPIPGLRVPVGLDAAIGLVPVVGDAVTTLLGAWIIYEARQLGAPGHAIARMVGNLMLDAVIGAVPLAGDVADVFFRANQRNVRLLQRYTGEPFIDSRPEA